MPHLTVQLFGSFEIRRGEQVLPRLRSRTGQWLLALLLLRAGREVEREWLAGTLWPESTGNGALANLRRTLTDLRHLLHEEAHYLCAPSPHSLCLDLPLDQCDLLAFDRAIKRGDPEALQQAVSLYRGPLLEGCLEEWLLPEREAREQAYLQALETLADDSSPGQAAAYLRMAVLRDPGRESVQRRLMTALAANGDYAEVTQTYRRLRLFLHQEALGEPAPETKALYHKLCGEVRQATMPHPADTLAARVPRAITPLIGREEDTVRIAAALHTARIVTLTGAGGIGKTRLAVHLAEELANDFAAGVWFADLASLADPALVPRIVLETLRLSGANGNVSDMDALITLIDRKDMLLILDNCEHLAPACARLAEVLLGACPALRLLATSRQPLGLVGEHLQPVSALTDSEAARLFVARGGEGLPGFSLTAENESAITEICRRLDGIPLALEMAAARLRAMSVTQIASRLEHGFPRLSGAHRKALPRQQTLRATMDWSYGLLSPSEQKLLRQLSVFAGGWTLEAAEQICTPVSSEAPDEQDAGNFGTVSDLVLSLVDQSLVLYLPEEEDPGRYRFLEPIRQYAAEKLRAEREEEEIRVRHRSYFLELAEEVQPYLEGPMQMRWLATLQTEHDNLRAAIVSSQDVSCDAEIGLRLVAALVRFWLVQGHLSEGQRHATAALDRMDPLPHSTVVVRALLAAGHLACWQNDWEAAVVRYGQSLQISRAIGDDQRFAWSLARLGIVAFLQGDLDKAEPFFQESLTLERQMDHYWVISQSLDMLGAVARCRGDHEMAWRLSTEGLEMRRALHDDHFTAASLDTLARIACSRGDYHAAEECLEELLILLKGLGDRFAAASALDISGTLTLAQKRQTPAQRFARAVRLFGAAGSLRVSVAAHVPPIDLEAYRQNLAEARAVLGNAGFDAAWAEGQKMTLVQSIAFALDDDNAEEKKGKI